MVQAYPAEFWHHLKALVIHGQQFVSSKDQNLLAIIEWEEKLSKDHKSKTNQCMDPIAVVLICVWDSQFEVGICLKKE